MPVTHSSTKRAYCRVLICVRYCRRIGCHPGAWRCSMSLRPEPIGSIPAETVRVAPAAFPKGTVVTRLRDEFSALYQDEAFRDLYPARGQPGLPPWRLALVTVFQFLEHLSDRQAADAVRARIVNARPRKTLSW